MSYTRKEILIKVEEGINVMPSFYNIECVNYRGKTSDTDELYTEVIAEYLCDNIDKLKSIPTILRRSSYKVESHGGVSLPDSNREEEIIAKDMFCMSKYRNFMFDEIGIILDYQVPLKGVGDDKAGKIDLLSCNGTTVRVLELKTKSSKETMLRCALEAFTYLQILDVEKCKADFGIDSKVEFEASPLVFIDSAQYKEYCYENRPHLRRLMGMLNLVPFFVMKVGEREYRVIR